VEILFCTDGSDSSIKVASLISKLEFSPQTKILILGVSENDVEVDTLKNSMKQIEQQLNPQYQVDQIIKFGSATDEILNEAIEGKYDLVTLGGGGKQLDILDPHVGRTTKKLTRKLSTHFLIGRNIPGAIDKILFCIGSIAPTSDTLKLGGEWISKINADISVLHVISKGIETQTQDDTITRNVDQEINRSVRVLNSAGIKGKITTHVKEGLVVEEVLKELEGGRYDLLVVGSHYQPGQDRWQGTLLDDITDQLLNRATCSMLII
jgi:nucleotide-binding universal stress UspA family protein